MVEGVVLWEGNLSLCIAHIIGNKIYIYVSSNLFLFSFKMKAMSLVFVRPFDRLPRHYRPSRVWRIICWLLFGEVGRGARIT